MKTESNNTDKRNKIILISVIAIVAVIGLIFISKDTILEKSDFSARKKAMLKAYNERVILKDKDENGFISTPNFNLKLDNLKVENNELSFDLLFDKDFSKVTKEDLSVVYGIKITDKNGKLVVYRDSSLLPSVANANKSNLFDKVEANKKRSINPYSYTYSEENNLDKLPEETDLTVEKNILLTKLVKEDNLYKAHASFKLKESVNAEDLEISINEIIILKENNEVFLYDQTHFTEWVF